MDQPRRPRPMDMGPRRSMDMRPGAGAASPQAPMPQRPMPTRPVASAPRPASTRPQPMPQQYAPQAPQRPMPQRPVQRPQQHAAAQQYAADGYPQGPQAVASTQKPKVVRKRNPFWRGLLQVVVSLLVIVGVAAVIVALYLKYYQ